MTVFEFKNLLDKYPPDARVKVLFESCTFDLESTDVFISNDGVVLIAGDSAYIEEYSTGEMDAA